MKLSGGSPSFASELNIDAFLEQVKLALKSQHGLHDLMPLGCTKTWSSVHSTKTFCLLQARSYDEASNNPLGWYIRNAQTRQLSHPLPVMRAREIDIWAQSPQYKALLAKNGHY